MYYTNKQKLKYFEFRIHKHMIHNRYITGLHKRKITNADYTAIWDINLLKNATANNLYSFREVNSF